MPASASLSVSVELRLSEKSARKFQNLIVSAQFPVLSLQGLELLAFGTGHALANTRVHFGLLDPFQQGRRHTADLRCNGFNCCPKGWVLAPVFLHHAYSAFEHFW